MIAQIVVAHDIGVGAGRRDVLTRNAATVKEYVFVRDIPGSIRLIKYISAHPIPVQLAAPD
jgi:hypothetical protein